MKIRNRLVFGLVSTVALLLSVLAPVLEHRAGAKANANFVFERGVSESDATLVREGIRLAQDYFVENMGAANDHTISVRAVETADDDSESTVAAARGNSIVVYTGSPGWVYGSPAERLATILHEYTHIYQYQSTASRDFTSAGWFDEGLAEYVAIDRLAELGIVDRTSILLYEAGLVQRYAKGLRLSEIEDWEDFAAVGADAYPLAFFGVANLLAEREMTQVQQYYKSIADGATFDEAFESSFGLLPDAYYTQFEDEMRTLSGSTALPGDYEVAEGVERNASVRVLQLPDLTRADEQSLVRARTLPAADCMLVLSPDDVQETPVERPTFADGDGDVFWLITIPPDWQTGTAQVSISCGGPHISSSIQIAAQ